MEATLAITHFCRRQLDGYFDTYSPERLNKIPDGFNNNLIWNIAHIIVTQQLIVNKLSGLPVMVSDDMIAKYMRGTKPAGDVSEQEMKDIRALIFSTIENTKTLINENRPPHFTAYTTSTGYAVNDVETAVEFNNYHEATHLGVMMGIRKFV